MSIDPTLLDAYRATEYRVQTNGGVKILKVDTPSEFLSEAHRLHLTDRSAFITAYNPFSKAQDDAFNNKATQDLLNDIKGHWSRYEGEGADPTGQWPPEKSFLIVGINYKDAAALAYKYGQNAFLYAFQESTPRLVTLVSKADSFPYGYVSNYDDDALVGRQEIKVNFQKGKC